MVLSFFTFTGSPKRRWEEWKLEHADQCSLRSCWPCLPLLEPSQFCQPQEHWSSGERGEEDCSRSDLILPCPEDSIGNQGKVRVNLKKSGLHLRARIDGTTFQIHLILKSVHGSTPDPLTLWVGLLTPFKSASAQRTCPLTTPSPRPVLGWNFANTRECGGEEGLGLNDPLLLVHQDFIEPPPLIKHNAWSWRYRNELNTSLLMRCLKAI